MIIMRTQRFAVSRALEISLSYSVFLSLFLSLFLFVARSLHAQDGRPVSEGLKRSAFGISLLGLAPRGEFADNVGFAGGAGGSYMLRLGESGVVALRADVGYMVYGHERYRTTLGG